jgi:hypothetical protein
MAKVKDSEMTGWTGWIAFASFALLLVGIFHLIAGFVALFKDDIYLSINNVAWVFSYTSWGWIHIIGGILSIIAAGSLMQGKMYGRIIAVIVAFFAAIANMAFIPIYPVWSIIMLVINIVVIWAVIVHGNEMKIEE